jgi:hypothetical protein
MSTIISPLLKVKERIIGPSGIYGIDNVWYGYADEFKYTIGLAGLMGFGVGCCPPELLPADMAPLPGTEDRFSPNYGTYIHLPSASIQCFVPAHYIDVQAPGNTNAPAYGTKVVISSTQSGDAVLPKAFQNDGGNLAGVFIDKYQGSNCRPDGSGLPNSTTGNPGELPNTGGIFASRPLHWPVSAVAASGTVRSPFSFCDSDALNAAITVAPTNDLGGAWQLCKTRGADFAPIPIWVRSQIAFLSLAHAQALLDTNGDPIAGATTNAAWMDVAPYAPKGNNSGGADVNKTILQFARTDIAGATGAGWAGESARAFTGAARIGTLSAVEHTTHNGQLCGIVDVNGNQWDITPGLTNVGGVNSGYRVFSDLDDYTTVSSNAGITGAANVISLAADVSDDGVWWGDDNAWIYLVPDVGGTYHPSSTWAANATRKAMAECGLPRQSGTSLTQTSTNIFGGDGLYRRHRADLLPRVGGSWPTGAPAGSFAVTLDFTSSSTNQSVGGRAARFLSV